MKIVLIGAGSENFGRGMIADLMQTPELSGRGIEMHLVDLDAQALDVMTRLAERIRRHTGSDIRIVSTTDRCEALPGADYVVVAVARKRYPLWEQDFRIPLAYGFRHCLGENGGPGALFHTLRSLELILPICRDIERLCPNALLLNFTNPEARVLHAILTLTKVRAAGLCHGVFNAIGKIAEYLKRPAEELDVVSAGMNHFYCVLGVKDRKTGKQHLDEALQMAAADTDAPPLFRKMAEIFGMFSYPSDDHIGEYVSFGSEFGGVKWHYGQECRRVHAKEPQAAAQPSMADYADGRRPLDEKALVVYHEILAVPIIAAIELDRKFHCAAVNVLNSQGYISNVPRDAAIEVPATADAAGIHPIHVGAIPEACAAMMRTQFSIISLLTEAYRTRSRKLLLQALLLDPTVNSITAASKMLDEMLALQSDFLPSFS
jgi:alpha-galactosidase